MVVAVLPLWVCATHKAQAQTPLWLAAKLQNAPSWGSHKLCPPRDSASHPVSRAVNPFKHFTVKKACSKRTYPIVNCSLPCTVSGTWGPWQGCPEKFPQPKGRTPAARLLTTFSQLPTLRTRQGPGQAVSHRSCGHQTAARTPRRVRAPLFGFRKIHLYGKSKKSTHGHQTQIQICSTFLQPGLI